MSELLDNARKRKDLLKHMILQLHSGHAPEAVRKQLVRLLGQVPYDDVVEVEQELIREGLPVEDVLKLCDVHTAALKGAISQEGAKTAPKGHPVHTFRQENRAMRWEIRSLGRHYAVIEGMADDGDATDEVLAMRADFNRLMDVDKHYQRKENLLFPFLEKHGIDGPPKVMWGKHDETRELLKGAIEALSAMSDKVDAGEARSLVALVLSPASESVEAMIDKEEQILFPMSLDTLDDGEWYEVYRGSDEIGYCLYDPIDAWRPEGIEPGPEDEAALGSNGRIQLKSGSFTVQELTALLNTIPFDLTFVDRDDTVRFFTQGKERIFARTRAILGRKVQYCHPPSSVHIVDRILAAFRDGEQDQSSFWIQMKGRFISIEYFALRGDGGEYLGCLEVSQDLTDKRALTGEQRLLAWDPKEGAAHD
ncbi:MAG: DUF438 domain-containing protein [Deltaproteobacteria bacterium]|nr:DUF438 domain-containing protein [Deltaproteobacteria bacterium]